MSAGKGPRVAHNGEPLARRGRAFGEPPHPGEELTGVERLDDVVVCADEEPCDPIHWLCPIGREEDDGQFVPELIAQFAADLIATDVR